MDVIQLSDGSVEIISSVKDFGELIDKKLGSDAKRWFDDMISYYQYFVEEVNDEYR